MYKIIPPLQPNMQGKDVANLQSALKILQEKRFFRIRDQEQAEKIEANWDEEVSNSLYGEATYELVRLVQEKYDLETSGEVDKRTAEILNEILMEFGVFEEKSSPFKVEGTVLYTNEDPVTGITVQVFDKDLRGEEFLRKTTTNQDGKYEIIYSRQQFRRVEKKNADLIVRVFAEDDPDQILAESDTLFNAPEVATINLTLESKLSEYERLFNTLLPLFQGEDVSPIDFTEEDIDFLVHESGFEADILRVFVAANRMTVELSIDKDLSFYDITALFYALGCKGEQLKLPELLKQDFYELRNELKEAIKEKLIPAHLSEWLDNFFSPAGLG